MATFAQIKEIRIRVDDPPGFQDFIEAANAAALPAVPAPYAAYKLTDTGAYVATELESGAASSDYSRLDLRVSDARISSWIDSYSLDQAECFALSAIAQRLAADLNIKRASVGSEDVEYTSLLDAYRYYKELSDQCKEDFRESQNNSTGRYGTTVAPEIAGGEV